MLLYLIFSNNKLAKFSKLRKLMSGLGVPTVPSVPQNTCNELIINGRAFHLVYSLPALSGISLVT